MPYPLPQGRGRDLRNIFVVQKWSPGGICHTILSGDKGRADREGVVRLDFVQMPTRNEEGVDRSRVGIVYLGYVLHFQHAYEITAAQDY